MTVKQFYTTDYSNLQDDSPTPQQCPCHLDTRHQTSSQKESKDKLIKGEHSSGTVLKGSVSYQGTFQ